jgi:CheY-like chemotaxis protein
MPASGPQIEAFSGMSNVSGCPNIVIIEDDADIRDTLRAALEYEGFEVWAYSNGREAIDGLSSCKQPCLILLDLMMPVMDGWQFLKERKSLGDTIASIPVIIVSAVADRSRVTGQETEGVRHFVRKPVDLDMLFNLVRSYCPTCPPTNPKKKAA